MGNRRRQAWIHRATTQEDSGMAGRYVRSHRWSPATAAAAIVVAVAVVVVVTCCCCCCCCRCCCRERSGTELLEFSPQSRWTFHRHYHIRIHSLTDRGYDHAGRQWPIGSTPASMVDVDHHNSPAAFGVRRSVHVWGHVVGEPRLGFKTGPTTFVGVYDTYHINK